MFLFYNLYEVKLWNVLVYVEGVTTPYVKVCSTPVEQGKGQPEKG